MKMKISKLTFTQSKETLSAFPSLQVCGGSSAGWLPTPLWLFGSPKGRSSPEVGVWKQAQRYQESLRSDPKHVDNTGYPAILKVLNSQSTELFSKLNSKVRLELEAHEKWKNHTGNWAAQGTESSQGQIFIPPQTLFSGRTVLTAQALTVWFCVS